MLKYMMFLIVLISLSACGKAPMDNEVLPEVADFESTYNVQVNLEIKLVDSIPAYQGAIGVCYATALNNHIELIKDFWLHTNDLGRHKLLFHELGHCIFGRKHSTEMYPDGCPKSIMLSSLLTDECFNTHHDELIKELVDNKGK